MRSFSGARVNRALCFGVAAGLVAVSGLAAVSALAAEAGAPKNTEWPAQGGSLNSQQYSSLDQINTSNVSTVGLLWSADLPIGEGLVGNPLVRDGVIYQSGPGGRAVANNARTGALLWAFTPEFDMSKYSMWTAFSAQVNRGLALDDTNVYVAGGCELYAVDRRTGKQVWHSEACNGASDLGVNTQPIVGGGKVFVGIMNNQLGTDRGFAAAHDAKTGKELWRFYTVPGDPKKPYENKQMEIASKTWGDHYWTETKGAAGVWGGMVYDPKTDLFIFGSGNPAIDGHEAEFADKQMLYSDSLIAIHALTGRYAWHLQEVTGDVFHPGDATAHMMLADLPIRGATRHVVMQAAKSGFFFIVDAETGEFVSANNYVPTENYNPIDLKTGSLSFKKEKRYWEVADGKNIVLQPGGWGAHAWELSSYSPKTGLVYIPGFIFPYSNFFPGTDFRAHAEYGFKPGAKYQTHGRLIAWDPVTQTERWHVERVVPINGGVLSTAGNVVFQGTPGVFSAYDAASGRSLWTYKTNSIILAGASTVLVDGKQLVLVPSGDGTSASSGRDGKLTSTPETMSAPSRLLAFALGGTATLPPAPLHTLLKPVRPRQPAALVTEGAALVSNLGCENCHGTNLTNSGRGRVPDLRNIREERFQAMPAILRQGALAPLGMPRFPKVSEHDVAALQAFIMNQAWDAYDKQERH